MPAQSPAPPTPEVLEEFGHLAGEWSANRVRQVVRFEERGIDEVATARPGNTAIGDDEFAVIEPEPWIARADDADDGRGQPAHGGVDLGRAGLLRFALKKIAAAIDEDADGKIWAGLGRQVYGAIATISRATGASTTIEFKRRSDTTTRILSAGATDRVDCTIRYVAVEIDAP